MYVLMSDPERSLLAGKPEVSVAPLGCPDDGSGLIRAWTLEDCRVSMSVAAAFQQQVQMCHHFPGFACRLKGP